MSLFKRRRFPVRSSCSVFAGTAEWRSMPLPSSAGCSVTRPSSRSECVVSGLQFRLLAVDETYVRVGGQWKYMFRVIDKHG